MLIEGGAELSLKGDASTSAWHGKRQGMRTSCSDSERAMWQERFGRLLIIRHLGAAVDLSSRYACRLAVASPQPFHQGGLGTQAINGATLSGLSDCALAICGITHLGGRKAGTIDFSIHFMAPVPFAPFEVIAWVHRRTRSIVYAQADVIDHRGRLCCTATGAIATSVEASPSTASDAGQWHSPVGLSAQEAPC